MGDPCNRRKLLIGIRDIGRQCADNDRVVTLFNIHTHGAHFAGEQLCEIGLSLARREVACIRHSGRVDAGIG